MTGAAIVPLRDATDPALVGGKAVNLAAMIRAGLPVPDGFVITTAAFRGRGENDSISAELATQIQTPLKSWGARSSPPALPQPPRIWPVRQWPVSMRLS
jgi:phosphoenolpyruvate synthase/pyruvate phosphate dikinase